MKAAHLDLDSALDMPFLLALMNAFGKIGLTMTKRKGYASKKNNYHLLNDHEKKTSRMFRLSSSLITTVRDIRVAYALINRRPGILYLEKNEISELEYIKFHYEVIIHKIRTISEIIKLIANENLEINLPYKDCSWARLVRYKTFNSSACKKIIQQYFDDFETLIENRHLNAHRGIYEDTEMDDINLDYTLYQWYKKYNIHLDEEYKKIMPYPYVKYRVKAFKKKKLKEVLEFEQLVFKHMRNFFKSLEWKD